MAYKSILSTLKDDADYFFGIKYNMNLYRGCQHSCIYCDSRSSCYNILNFDTIEVKENSLEILEKVLRSKRKKGTIGTGSMNDPYMPIELKEKKVRGALELIAQNRFPVHIITKSNLVLRDTDLIKRIGEIYSAVSITITTFDDKLSQLIEPNAPKSSERFQLIKQLSEQGIYCGVVFMPVLPFITDSDENIVTMVKQAKENGANYIIASLGVTLRDIQKEYFFKQLDLKFSGIKHEYIKRYKNQYMCPIPDYERKYDLFIKTCKELDIPTRMEFYNPPEAKQLSLFDNL